MEVYPVTVLMVDEMYLKKSSQYHGGDYVGEDDNGKLYTGIVVFMIVGVKDSVPQARIQRGDLGIYPPSIFCKSKLFKMFKLMGTKD